MTFINNPLLIRYFDHTPHAGVLPPSPSVSVARHGVADNEGLLELSLDIRDDRVVTARFRAYGPPAYIAAAEWLCEAIEGCSVSDLTREITSSQLLDQLRLSDHWGHVAQLVLDTMQLAIRDN